MHKKYNKKTNLCDFLSIFTGNDNPYQKESSPLKVNRSFSAAEHTPTYFTVLWDYLKVWHTI